MAIDKMKYKSLDTIKKALTKSSYDEKQWELFKQFTIELDKMRDTDIKTVVEELAGEFNV